MKKAYDPIKMIFQSRFRDYYKTWTSNDQTRLVNTMTRLIGENSSYSDPNNYGHLCNLITSLAMVMVLEENGKTRQEAQNSVASAMYEFIQPMIPSMQKLASHGWFVGFLKFSMPIKFRHTLGYGWDVEFPECPRDTFTMITHKCIYHEIFSRYGMPEMTAKFCKVDDIMYSELPRRNFCTHSRSVTAALCATIHSGKGNFIL